MIIACMSENVCIIKNKKTCGNCTKVEPTKVKMSKHVRWIFCFLFLVYLVSLLELKLILKLTYIIL